MPGREEAAKSLMPATHQSSVVAKRREAMGKENIGWTLQKLNRKKPSTMDHRSSRVTAVRRRGDLKRLSTSYLVGLRYVFSTEMREYATIGSLDRHRALAWTDTEVYRVQVKHG